MEQRIELARVLVIDNDPQVGVDLCEMLEPLGYTVKFICTDGLDVPGAIIEEARFFRPHVAIVDVRLVDDYTPDSHTVFDLLGYLKSARCVLYSAYLDANVTRKANREKVFDWHSKAGAPDELVETVINAAKAVSARAANANIPWPLDWDKQSVLAKIAGQVTSAAPETIVDDVLVQLLPGYQPTRLNPMRQNTKDPIAASRGHSAVLALNAQGFAPNVFKLAKATRIRDERDNYAKHIDNKLPGGFHTRLLGSIDFWDVGGALYSFVGTEETALPSLSEHYRTVSEPQEIVAPIDFFVRQVWRTHYNARTASGNLSLFTMYDKVFNIRTRLHRINDSAAILSGGYSHDDVAELLNWATHFEIASTVANVYEAVTHGDFHGDNIFVHNGSAWVIDFERTGIHHVLLDFVELQVDILTRLIPAEGIDASMFVNLAEACTSRNADQARQQIRSCSSCNKARRVISRIQQLAEEECGPHSHAEMLWGMLFDALYVATIDHITQQQRERALLLSIAIMRQLKQPD